MDPEFGLGLGRNRRPDPSRPPRPSLLVRALEGAGLVLVAYGLGSYRFGWVVPGAAMIIASYALYREKHGSGMKTPGAGPSSDSGPWGEGGDG